MKHLIPLDQVERNYCDCDKCKCGCKTMPGMLAPGDLNNIAEFLGVSENDDNWMVNNFVASEGARVVFGGSVRNIATITPKQDATGRCVFLDANDACSIHKVSPFGCRTFRICNEDESSHHDHIEKAAEDTQKIGNALRHCIMDEPYNESWEILHDSGCHAQPLDERRRKMVAMLRELE
jgi:Fe-S-cluster containining protein